MPGRRGAGMWLPTVRPPVPRVGGRYRLPGVQSGLSPGAGFRRGAGAGDRRRRGSNVRASLGISPRSDAELLKPWAGVRTAPTQVLGTEVYDDGFFEGLLFPSAQ